MRIKKQNPESILTHSIRQFLNYNGIFHFKHWAGPFSEKGVPDLIGVLPNGKFLGVEVKTETGKVSREQSSFIERITENFGCAFVARSVDEVQRYLLEREVKLRLTFKGV